MCLLWVVLCVFVVKCDWRVVQVLLISSYVFVVLVLNSCCYDCVCSRVVLNAFAICLFKCFLFMCVVSCVCLSLFVFVYCVCCVCVLLFVFLVAYACLCLFFNLFLVLNKWCVCCVLLCAFLLSGLIGLLFKWLCIVMLWLLCFFDFVCVYGLFLVCVCPFFVFFVVCAVCVCVH